MSGRWQFRTLGAAVLSLVSVAYAAPVSIPHGSVELLSEVPSLQPGKSFYAGLKFKLETGWHIYWINPGDAGQPPKLTWQLPAGITAGPIEWPYPKRLAAFSAVDFGYEDEVLLLIPMKAGPELRNGGSANLAAEVRMIVCREMCIPGRAQVAAKLPVQAQSGQTRANPLFAAARRKLPQPAPRSWEFRATDQTEAFLLSAVVGGPIRQAVFFPLEESQIENAAPQVVRTSKTGFEMRLQKSSQLLKPIPRLRGVLLLGDKAYDVNAPVR